MKDMFGILLLNFFRDIGLLTIQVGYLRFSGFCGCRKRLDIAVGRGKAIETLHQIAFKLCFM